MYLRGSKWSMSKRRKPLNLFKIAILVLFVGAMAYFDLFIAPIVQPIGIPTPTPTRDPESFISDAEQLFLQGKLTQSIDAYQLAIASRPKDAAVYIALARVQVFAGRYVDAQTSAENALLLNPNNSTAHAVRGWALDFQGDFPSASDSITRALQLDPNNALAHAYYAELLADEYSNNTGSLDVIDKMAEESRVAIKLGPNLMEAHRARGYVLEAIGGTDNYEEAINDYQAAIAINGNLADLHLALGRVYRALGVIDKAEASLARANTLNPSDPTPDYLLSRIYANVGEYGKAEQYAQQAVVDRPDDAGYHGNLGAMYYKNAKYDQAIQELSLVINGGTTAEGISIKPLDLTATARTPEYFFTYGLVLAKSVPPRCGEALPIAQKILDRLRDDEISTYNANEIVHLCTEASGTTTAPTETPAVTPTP
jgi:tetratricopeptide (TPR) repeat protein